MNTISRRASVATARRSNALADFNRRMSEAPVLSVAKVESFLRNQEGRIVTVLFTKRDGELRRLTGMVAAKPNTVTSNPAKPFVCMFDTALGQYRNVNLETVECITAQGRLYKVRKNQ